MSFNTVALPGPVPGSHSNLVVHQLGPENGLKVYIQAGLHADEHPGLLVAQHLLQQLQTFEKAGQLKASFVLVPFANPIGLRQTLFGKLAGRCDLHTGQNFNRQMAVSPSAVDDALLSELQGTPAENDQRFRAFLREQVAQRTAEYEITALHKTLLSHSIDAHFMLDLHCDDVALPHVFYGVHQQKVGQQLARHLGAAVALEEDVTGTVAFDGTHSQPWVLAEQRAAIKFEQPCFAATVELRGQTDVNDSLAADDAQRMVNFFIEQGLIDALPITFNTPQPVDTIGTEQVKMIAATHAGVVTYRCALGDRVQQGDLLAEIVLLDQPEPTRIPVTAPCDGLVFSQTGQFFVSLGHTLLMLATHEAHLKAGQQLAY